MFSILFTTSLLSLGMARGESLLVSGYSSNIEVFTLTGSPANHTLEKDSMWPVDANLTWLQVDEPNTLQPGDSVYAIHEVLLLRHLSFPPQGLLVCTGPLSWEVWWCS